MNNEQIILALKNLIAENPNKILTVAIDGPSASGKTNLSDALQTAFDCNIFHMDDFFLPFERKTPERLSQAGGNVDYERVEEELLKNIIKSTSFEYDIYSCKSGDKVPSGLISSKNLNIIEGVYSMHPTLIGYYDYKIFLDVERNTQLRRILNRSNEFMLNKFKTEWIPLEDNYFSTLNTKTKADLVLDTTNLF